jgi:hypothetical protein
VSLNLSNLQEFTDDEIIKLLRHGIAHLAISQSVVINGRVITRAQMPAMLQALKAFEERQEAATAGDIAVARFGEPTTARSNANC